MTMAIAEQDRDFDAFMLCYLQRIHSSCFRLSSSDHIVNQPCAVDLLESERDGLVPCRSAISRSLDACHENDSCAHRVRCVVYLLYGINSNLIWPLTVGGSSWNGRRILHECLIESDPAVAQSVLATLLWLEDIRLKEINRRKRDIAWSSFEGGTLFPICVKACH